MENEHRNFEQITYDFEHSQIIWALTQAKGNGTKAAALLSMSYRSWRHYSRKHGLSKPEYNKNPKEVKAKLKAGVILRNAVLMGDILRPSVCSSCKLPSRIEAHHPDYSKPLDVIWLCGKCHRLEHLLMEKLERIKKSNNEM